MDYTLGIVQGSRVDEFCFSCKSLKFIKNDTRLKCNARFGASMHRYLEPLLQDVTIRPEGSAGVCLQISAMRGDDLAEKLKRKEYFETQTRRQIENHEKVANPVEMYRVDFVGYSQNGDIGAHVRQVPVNRDSLREGDVVVVDKVNRKVWMHIPTGEPPRGGVGGLFKKMFDSSVEHMKTLGQMQMEDSRSLSFLRDALKRDILQFAFEKTYAGSESPEFWSVIAKSGG